MSRKFRLRGPFQKQHGKRAKALFKSASQHLYHIDPSPPRKLNGKKSLLLTWRMLGLLVRILSAHERYLIRHGGRFNDTKSDAIISETKNF